MDKGIKASRIILGGFSQGGAMSVFTGLTSSEKLGGVFGLSCYLLLSDRIKNFLPEEWANKKTPFFLGHGEDDDVVRFSYGQKSADMLKEIGLEDVKFNRYSYVLTPLFDRWVTNICSDLGHSADPEEIDDLEKFIEKSLAENENASAGL
jgi:lysophospholipase-1